MRTIGLSREVRSTDPRPDLVSKLAGRERSNKFDRYMRDATLRSSERIFALRAAPQR